MISEYDINDTDETINSFHILQSYLKNFTDISKDLSHFEDDYNLISEFFFLIFEDQDTERNDEQVSNENEDNDLLSDFTTKSVEKTFFISLSSMNSLKNRINKLSFCQNILSIIKI
jgi:hypothetical protein